MTSAEEESIEQASSARRERLKALRAAKEFASMPDDNANNNPQDSATAEPAPANNVVMAEEESVQQAAAARRERLKALRTAKELLSTPDEGSIQNGIKAEESEETEEEKLNMKFRNYLPHDKQLQDSKLAPTVLPKFEDPVAAAPLTSATFEDPFVNIAPKKPNWDLRRDVQKRLDLLERRTQKAIYKLMQQEKEKEEMNAEDLITED